MPTLEQLLLPALDRHAQVGGVLERGVRAVSLMRPRPAPKRWRTVDGHLPIEEPLRDGPLESGGTTKM